MRVLLLIANLSGQRDLHQESELVSIQLEFADLPAHRADAHYAIGVLDCLVKDGVEPALLLAWQGQFPQTSPAPPTGRLTVACPKSTASGFQSPMSNSCDTMRVPGRASNMRLLRNRRISSGNSQM